MNPADAAPRMKRTPREPQDSLLTIQQAATRTSLSVHTLYTMVSQRRIPFIRFGKAIRFDPVAIERWIQQHTVLPMPDKRY